MKLLFLIIKKKKKRMIVKEPMILGLFNFTQGIRVNTIQQRCEYGDPILLWIFIILSFCFLKMRIEEKRKNIIFIKDMLIIWF